MRALVAACVAMTGVSAQTRWTAPKTPWGDPDISGNLTNVFEASTPFERPEQFAGRRRDDVKGEELARFRASLQQRTRDNFEGPLHGPDHWWQDVYDLRKGGAAWFVIDPPDGKIPVLTDAGRRRAAAGTVRGSYAEDSSWRGPEDFTLYDRCITRGVPGSMMPAIYGNSYQISQAPGMVAIRYEMIHETRLVPLDGRPHVGAGIRLDMGDARGHWEGNTLVVETTNFTQRSAYRNADASALTLVERFTRTAPDKILWTVTVDDPKTWVSPWTFGMPLTIMNSEAIMPYECHEGNIGLKDMLEVARAHDHDVR
ncbi:MAG TPA: hypothetical protein VG871_14300 [Vicinamibacterales bacterium]|nr:hypothetical protein [Vicinamibacterales bacterium]